MNQPFSSNAFHNYKYELESLQTKFAWFDEQKLSVYDLFENGDVDRPLNGLHDIPNYIVEQIATIRNWYLEMKQSEN